MNPYFEELMVSEYVWLVDKNDVVLPVNQKILVYIQDKS